MSKLQPPGTLMSKLPLPGSSVSKLPLPGATSCNLKLASNQIEITNKRKHAPQEDQTSKRAKLEISARLNLTNEGSTKMTKMPFVNKTSTKTSVTAIKRNYNSKPSTRAILPLKKAVTGETIEVKTSKIDSHGRAIVNESAAFKLPPNMSSFSATSSAPPIFTGKKRAAWDTKGRLEDMESAMAQHLSHNTNLQHQILSSNERIASLESVNNQLSGTIKEKEIQSNEASGEIQTLQKKLRENEEELLGVRMKWRREVEELEFKRTSLERQKTSLEGELIVSQEELKGLKMNMSQLSSAKACIESHLSAVKLNFAASEDLNCKKDKEIIELQEMINHQRKLIEESNNTIFNNEIVRRKLHNTIQELKGNIRVFCRVRPLIGDESSVSSEMNHIHFPDEDHKILELDRLTDNNLNESLSNMNCRGGATSNKYEFSFDHVFGPQTSQAQVFEEISQLVQSALDGYNVCIFAYGQTGSGKTFTMEGPSTDHLILKDNSGMIPRAVEQIFETAGALVEKGWKFDIEVSFLEIYNETIRDLLNNNGANKDVKHDIRMTSSNSNEVYVTELTIVKVANQQETYNLLKKASHNRSVAETKCNERSSRSHCVFRMKISGQNEKTMETSTGLLNLIDLAGSERLKESGSQGLRLKETQNINKSLANLGNVIMALANKESHVPYRNSKLTYLLQNCLGGSSKMLMFVNVSPKEECLKETLNSLRFATKVNECNIGTAQKKVK